MRSKHETLDDLLDLVGLPLRDVCACTGISERGLWKLRRGVVARPRIATVAALASLCRCDVRRVRAAIATACRLAAKES